MCRPRQLFHISVPVSPLESEPSVNRKTVRRFHRNADSEKSLNICVICVICGLCSVCRQQHHSFTATEDPCHTSGHQRCQRGSQKSSQTQTRKIITARRSQYCSTTNEDCHSRDVRKSAKRVTQNHHSPWICDLATRD